MNTPPSPPPSGPGSGQSPLPRAWATGNPGMAEVLRRGAWYPVIGDSGTEIVVEVDGKPIHLPKPEVRLRPDRPECWSVVVRTGVMRPTLAGTKMMNRYAVCPDCAGRQEFEGHPESLMCLHCRRAAKVDWSTTY